MTTPSLEAAIRILIDTKDGQSQLSALSDAFVKHLQSIGKTAEDFDAIKQLSQDLETGKVQAEECAAEMVQLAEVWRKMSAEAADKDLLGLRAHVEIQQQIEQTRAAYERLKESGVLTDKELAQAALKTQERIRDLEKQTNGWVESLWNAKASIGGVAGAFSGLVLATGKAMDFESAMADVAKVVDGTDEQMQRLTGRIKELSRELPLAATELAQIAAAGGQLGVPIEKLETFVRLSAQMSTAFGMSAEEAGQAVAKLSNVFNLPIEAVRDLGDAINTLGNTTAATEASIVEVLTRIGGTAKQFGLSAEQASALASTMLSMGVSAQVAGTGINALLNKLQTATIQGKDFQNALGAMGLSAQELAADIQAHPQAALIRFLQTLNTVDKASRAEILSRLFGAEYQDDIARLLGGLEQYEESLARVSDAAGIAGAMQDEFNTRVQTTQAQLQLLQNAADEIVINLGSVFLPVIRHAASGLGDVAACVARLVETFPGLSAAFASLATAAVSVGTLRLAFAAFKVAGEGAAAGIAAKFAPLLANMGALGAMVGKLGTLLKVSFGPVVTTLTTSYTVAKALKEEFLFVELAGIKIAETFTKIGATARFAMEAVGAIFSDDTIEAANDRFLQNLENIDSAYSDIAQSAKDAREEGTKTATETAESLEQTGKAAKDAAVQILTGEQAAKQLQSALKAAGEAGEDAGDKLREALNGFDLDDTGGIRALNDALDEVGEKAQAVREQLQAALDGMNGAELSAFAAQLDEAFARGEISAQRFAEINDQVLAASFAKLGADAGAALGKIRPQAQDAIDTFGLLAQRIAGGNGSAQEKMHALAQAADAALGQLKNGAEVDGFIRNLEQLRDAGVLSADAFDRLAGAARAAQSTMGGVGEAFKAAGIQTRAELEKMAAEAKARFEIIKNSGEATAEGVRQAFEQWASADAAAGGIERGAIQAQAAMLGLQVTVDEAGKVTVSSMNAAAASMDKVAQAGEGAADAAQAVKDAASGMADAHGKAAAAAESSASAHLISWQSIARAGRITADELNQYADAIQGAWMRTKDLITSKSLYFNAQGVGQKIQDEMRAAIAMAKSVDNAIVSLQSGHATMRDLQQAAGIAQNAVGKVGDERLNALRSALQDAQNRMRELSATAKDALSSVRDELDQLRGNTEALEKRRGEEKLRELQAKLAEAQAQGNTQAVSDLSEAIRLQKQLNAEKLKAAREEQNESRNSGGGGTSSSSASSGGGGVQTVRTVNVRLGNQSARVIETDQAALLEMIERARAAS